jgi:hypothetical protein
MPPARGGAAAPAAQYRVTVATAHASSAAFGSAGAPRALLSARGEGGAPLGPWPLVRLPNSGMPPPLARSTADSFVLSAPADAAAAAGALTHIRLWVEDGGAAAAGKAGAHAAPSWRAALHAGGGGGAAAAWHVQWVTIEELPAAAPGGAAGRRAARDGDDDADDASSASSAASDASDDEDAPLCRTFFFAVDSVRLESRAAIASGLACRSLRAAADAPRRAGGAALRQRRPRRARAGRGGAGAAAQARRRRCGSARPRSRASLLRFLRRARAPHRSS